jgi:hypothetical protein
MLSFCVELFEFVKPSFARGLAAILSCVTRPFHPNLSAQPSGLLSMPPNRDMGVEADEVLQAVVIAESFNQRFQPLTANKPRVGPISCSFSNITTHIPLIDYTCECTPDLYGCSVYSRCAMHLCWIGPLKVSQLLGFTRSLLCANLISNRSSRPSGASRRLCDLFLDPESLQTI